MSESTGVSDREKDGLLRYGQYQIYEDALPFQADRLDLALLTEAVSEGSDLLDLVLEGGELVISEELASGLAGTFRHFMVEENNWRRLKGSGALGLGFPFFLARAGRRSLVAPLFIWGLSLEPVQDGNGAWLIRFGGSRSLRLNQRVVHWASRYREASGLAELRAFISMERPGRKALETMIGHLAGAWKLVLDTTTAELAQCPNLAFLDEWCAAGGISWTGLIGIFPPQIRENEHVAMRQLLRAGHRRDDGHPFGCLTVDPYQASALQALAADKTTVVAGAAGTGKTRLVLQSITNALSNGRKCLVAAPALGELEELHQQLSQLGLGHLALLLRNPTHDHQLVSALLRLAADQPPPLPRFAEDDFRLTLDKCRREKARLDESYHALRRPIFGKASWAEVVGKFLASNRREGKELLSGQLNVQDFSYGEEEYQELRSAIRQSQSLYRSINTLRHPLQNLNDSLFLTKEQEEARRYVFEQVDHFQKKFAALHKEFLVVINNYSDQLNRLYDQWFNRLNDQLEPLRERINDAVNTFGRDFELTSLTSLRLYGAMMSRFRRMLHTKEEIFAAYRQLVADHQAEPHFDFSFPPAREGRDLPRIREALEDFRNRLLAWRDAMPAAVREEASRLSIKANHPRLDFQETLIGLERTMDELLEEVNAADIYREQLENKMLTIPRRRKLLEEIMEQLENSRLFMRDFDHFYGWQRHWLQLSEPARKIVRALIKVKPVDWLSAFESWYFNTCLHSAYDPALPVREPALRQFIYNYEQLRQMMPAQISHYWLNRRQASLRDFKKSDRQRYQQLFARKEGEMAPPLSEMLEKDLDLLTDLLPVLLVGPAVLAYLPEPGDYNVDLVIIGGGHQFPAEAALPALRLGNRHLITGDPALLPLHPDGVLLTAALDAGLQMQPLGLIHRLNPGNLFQLGDASLIADHASELQEYRYLEIEGCYDEHSATNDVEAGVIIDLLLKTGPTAQRQYPAVGILTFTEAQRDLIADKIMRIKQEHHPGEEVIKQLERSGLGVFHIEETDGLHFDTLILSPAYGPVNADGLLSEHIGQLNRPQGLAQLKLLFSRPYRSLQVVSSLPATAIEEFSQQKEPCGTFFLANYFKYIKAGEQSDHQKQEEVYARVLPALRDEKHANLASPTFLEEVIEGLRPYIAEERMTLNEMETHLRLPLKIAPSTESGMTTVIIPDGFFANRPATDHLWEFQQLERYRDQNYRLWPVWSVNWWKNAQAEARKVAGILLENEESL